MDFETVLDRMREQEGGLVEIIALDSSYDAWQNVLDELRRSGYGLKFEKNGQSVPPRLGPEVFAGADSDYYRLSLLAAGQEWTSTMSESSTIDFQGSPEDIRSIADVEAVWQLMQDISATAGCQVIFIPESIDVKTVGRYLETAPPR